MTRKRRTFGAAFKAKVALAAAKGDRTTAQLASEYGVHAGQVTAWKRSSWYHVPQGESAENLVLMRAIDELSTKRPFSGSRTVCKHLGINLKRAQRLMRLLGLEAVYPQARSRAAGSRRLLRAVPGGSVVRASAD